MGAQDRARSYHDSELGLGILFVLLAGTKKMVLEGGGGGGGGVGG